MNKFLYIIIFCLLVGVVNCAEAKSSPASYALAHKQKNSTGKCWRYVKMALYKTGTIDSYPQTRYAKQAYRELTENYGFKKLNIKDPMKAPVNAVIVYGGEGAGHVEIRTKNGFVSDYFSPKPLRNRPVIAILTV